MNASYILGGAAIGSAIGGCISWAMIKRMEKHEVEDAEEPEPEHVEEDGEVQFTLGPDETMRLSGIAACKVLAHGGDWKRKDLLYFTEDQAFGEIVNDEAGGEHLEDYSDEELLAIVAEDQDKITDIGVEYSDTLRWYARGKDHTVYLISIVTLEDFATMYNRLEDSEG